MSRIIYGRIKKGGKIEVQRFYIKEFLEWEGEIELAKVESGKTLQQLRYLWGVVYKLVSEHTGFTPEEVSEVYKKRFLSYKKLYRGKWYPFTKGLSELKKTEMAEYVDKVIKHAQEELEIIIPEPDILYQDI